MSRIGFSQKIHHYQLQLRICSILDVGGLRNESSITIDFQQGRITNYHTDKDQVNTRIQEYVASDDELQELYDFFTLKAVEEFEDMPEHEKNKYKIGYYDCASLYYFMICGKGQIANGTRHDVYSNDPIQMAFEWMRRILPFDLL